MLRRYVEFSGRPQAVEVRQIAPGIAQVLLRDEEVLLMSDADAPERWGAWEYETRVPFSDGLKARVEANAEAWLSDAKAASQAEAAQAARAERDQLLAKCDQRMAIDRLGLAVPTGTTFTAWQPFLRELGEALSSEWAAYRQALRDIPEQPGFPYAVSWPAPPATL